jgi:hypothetical protein
MAQNTKLLQFLMETRERCHTRHNPYASFCVYIEHELQEGVQIKFQNLF